MCLAQHLKYTFTNIEWIAIIEMEADEEDLYSNIEDHGKEVALQKVGKYTRIDICRLYLYTWHIINISIKIHATHVDNPPKSNQTVDILSTHFLIPSFHPSIYLSIYLYIYIYIYLPTYLSIYLSILDLKFLL